MREGYRAEGLDARLVAAGGLHQVDDFLTGVNAQLGVEVGHMVVHRALADGEVFSDARIATPLGHQLQHVKLASGKAMLQSQLLATLRQGEAGHLVVAGIGP